MPTGSFAGISCVSKDLCIAVGSFSTGSGDSAPAPFAGFRSGGGSWSLQNLPIPNGVIGARLNAISCLSTAWCAAVGYTSNSDGTQSALAEHWDGSAWSIRQTVDTPGSHGTQLWGVSCVSSIACMAVGKYSYTGSVGPQVWAEAWDGTSWSTAAPPNPDSYGNLSGVSCFSAKNCVGVGSSTSAFTGQISTVAMQWNGLGWTILPMPPVPGIGELSGVACSASRTCIAVGLQNAGDLVMPLTEQWNGSKWRVLPTRSPSGTIGTYLDSVSCDGTNDCTASGYYGPSSGVAPILSLIETWDGKNWSIPTSPNPADAINALLLGVACPTQESCVTVGWYARSGLGPAGSPLLTLAESLRAGTWSVEPAPNPMGSLGAGFNGVSCVAANACEAVGFTADASGNYVTLAESWDGARWAVQATPNPQPPSSVFSAVSCASSVTCMAVGNYYNDTTPVIFAESWDGARWALTSLPNPYGSQDPQVNSISCPSPTWCTAVGRYLTTGYPQQYLPFAASWNGSSWSLDAVPTAPDAVTDVLYSVSCTSAISCMAVGLNSTRFSNTTLTERWDGTAWSLQPAANPLGFNPQLTSVSCVSASACEAIGDFGDGTGRTAALAESWDGSAWTLQSMPNPPGFLRTQPRGVSCTSATACTAVGYFATDSSFADFTLAETWDGTSWSIATIPSPPGDLGSRLNAVSCTSLCIAVGRGNGSSLALWDR